MCVCVCRGHDLESFLGVGGGGRERMGHRTSRVGRRRGQGVLGVGSMAVKNAVGKHSHGLWVKSQYPVELRPST